MKTIGAGTRVARGYYFNTRNWTLHPVELDGEVLRGSAQDQFLAVPAPVAFAAGPLMGIGFLMFLPLVGFIEVVRAAAAPVARLLGRSATEVAATLQPGVVAGQAHLAGKPAEDQAGAAAAQAKPPADELGELEKQIAEHRSK